MKKCTICGARIKKNNSALLPSDIAEKVKDYKKIKTICIDCKTDLLYAQIVSAY